MNKVTIIGCGSVGSTIAYTLTVTGIASSIVMVDVNNERAQGEAMDIIQGTPFCGPCAIHAGDYSDAVGSDIVIITAGVARKPGQSRLDLAQINVNILKSIISSVVKYAPDANYIIVSNPVDVLTYAFCKLSGVPEERVIGSGTILDTARLRSRLSECCAINQLNVHAYVFGEHGDSSFVPWTTANIANVPILQYNEVRSGEKLPPLAYDDIEDYVRKSGARIIQGKGATYYAVAISVCHICKALLDGIDTAMTVSTMLHGEYGIDDVCLSIVNVVGNKGAHTKVLLPLSPEEEAMLRKSADSLKAVINSITI